MSSVHNIAHHGDLSNSDQTKYVLGHDVINSFNDYILEWDEAEIKTYINDKLIFSYLKIINRGKGGLLMSNFILY